MHYTKLLFLLPIVFDGLGQEYFSQNYIGSAHAQVAMKIRGFKNFLQREDLVEFTNNLIEHFYIMISIFQINHSFNVTIGLHSLTYLTPFRTFFSIFKEF